MLSNNDVIIAYSKDYKLEHKTLGGRKNHKFVLGQKRQKEDTDQTETETQGDFTESKPIDSPKQKVHKQGNSNSKQPALIQKDDDSDIEESNPKKNINFEHDSNPVSKKQVASSNKQSVDYNLQPKKQQNHKEQVGSNHKNSGSKK